MADLSDLLGVVLKNPALLSTLASSLSGTEKERPAPASPVKTEATPERETLPAATFSKGGRGGFVSETQARRKKLFEGMRPYLKASTCTKLDGALALIGAMELLGASGQKGEE